MKKNIFLSIAFICIVFFGVNISPYMGMAQDATPGGPPIYVQIDHSKITLKHDPKEDYYNAVEGFSIKVGSTLPKWQISCIIEPLDKHQKEQQYDDDVVNVRIKNRNIVLSDSSPVLLFKGTKTGKRMIHCDELKFSVKVDPFKPPSTYRYRIHFLLKGSGFSRFINGPNFLLCYEHTQFVRVEMENGGISFGDSLEIGENQSQPAVISVFTNRENLHLVFSLDELNLVKKDRLPKGVITRGTIKSNMISLGGGFTTDAAIQNLHQKKYGQNYFGIDCPAGRHTIYVYSKLKIDIGHRPGDYEGVIKVKYKNHCKTPQT